MKKMQKFYYYDMETWFKGYAVAVQEEYEEDLQESVCRFALIKKEANEYIGMFGIMSKDIEDESEIRDLIASNIEAYINIFENEVNDYES